MLELDHRSRARLAERLLESLDALSEGEVAALWLEEAERRAAAWDAGEVGGIPAREALRSARSAE
ncbi:MAG: addiction module protein [Thermoanaerobaculia bacterium]